MGNIVLVGIGGAGMSGLAGLLLELGHTNIVGVDSTQSSITERLEQQGVKIYIGHGTYQVVHNDLVIYSHATVTSPEVQEAIAHFEQNHVQSVHPMLYAQFLGELSKYCTTIAVTGTHGKSSTSGLMAYTLQQINEQFGVAVIGAGLTDRSRKSYFLNSVHKKEIRSITDHILSRKGPYVEDKMKKTLFVVEADEYNKHFLHYDVDYGIITNCDIDHIDTYGTDENYYKTFLDFAKRVRHTLYVPKHHDEGTKRILEKLSTQKVAPSVIQVPTDHFPFKTLLGGHNHTNASLACAVVEATSSSSHETIKKNLSKFTGLTRRAEPLGKNTHGITILSDYGHHPIEIQSTLHALKEKYQSTPIHLIFQPHQITRVVEFREQFKDALQLSEHRYITPIYAAREKFDTIKTRYQNHPIQQSSSLESFTKQAADYRNATALETDTIKSTLDSIDNGIIVLFTAGDLDRLVREYLLESS